MNSASQLEARAGRSESCNTLVGLLQVGAPGFPGYPRPSVVLNKEALLSIQETKHPLNKDVFGAAIINPKEHTVIKAAH